ncbi:5'-nucleotidase SurE [Rickettsiales bacterium]|nr:5'-nucleotidase SurE [Rickettsiales bacterium]
MRVLITNDDGIQATGLSVLESIANKIFEEVWVVAPDTECSGFAHSITGLRPIRFRQLSERRFSISGTPADCVIMAVNEIMAHKKPDLVLSGVNRGDNIGECVTYSGTVGAAMEAALSGIPAIALSQAYKRHHPVPWKIAEELGVQLMKKFAAMGWPKKLFLNVNFPMQTPVKGIAVTKQGKNIAHCAVTSNIDPRGMPYYWLDTLRHNPEKDPENTDISSLQEGYITITPLRFDLTDYGAITKLKVALNEENEAEDASSDSKNR